MSVLVTSRITTSASSRLDWWSKSPILICHFTPSFASDRFLGNKSRKLSTVEMFPCQLEHTILSTLRFQSQLSDVQRDTLYGKIWATTTALAKHTSPYTWVHNIEQCIIIQTKVCSANVGQFLALMDLFPSKVFKKLLQQLCFST